ncbi:hypothetical protein PGTUg99_031012 [Puccinia graminis f. sp. tritici]|uniref:Uncharacterized protein n=1 Tax=Puccinia graminis f. sp. tritici TaxID=56615 RepID=A0A5B0Q8Y9_PUCGR|nr:hypothetical protein PGTUg99_031012 [Puccinia graminis f. sp. tritici]
MVDFSSPPTHPEPVLTHHPSSTLYRQLWTTPSDYRARIRGKIIGLGQRGSYN